MVEPTVGIITGSERTVGRTVTMSSTVDRMINCEVSMVNRWTPKNCLNRLK